MLNLTAVLQQTPEATGSTEGTPPADPTPVDKTTGEWLSETSVNVQTWFRDSAPDWLEKIALFLGIVIALRLIGGWVARILGRALDNTSPKTTQLMRTFVVSITRKAFLILGIVVGLDAIGIPVGPFLAGFGVAGLAIGFALKDTVSNFAAGVMILFYHPFEVGDYIEAGGSTGTVDAMNLSFTTLLSSDNQRILVPNSKIWGGIITNVTALDRRRLQIDVAVDRNQEMHTVEKVLKQLAFEHPAVFRDPEPMVRVNGLTDTSIQYILRVWTSTDDYGSTRWDLLRAIQLAFEKEDVLNPVQRREVHMHSVTG